MANPAQKHSDLLDAIASPEQRLAIMKGFVDEDTPFFVDYTYKHTMTGQEIVKERQQIYEVSSGELAEGDLRYRVGDPNEPKIGRQTSSIFPSQIIKGPYRAQAAAAAAAAGAGAGAGQGGARRKMKNKRKTKKQSKSKRKVRQTHRKKRRT